MKFSTLIALLSLTTLTFSLPLNVLRRAVDETLIPDLGFEAGQNPTGSGDCDGAVNGADGKPIKVPCSCPPDAATFAKALNENVDAGKAVNNPSVLVTFPEDDSKESQLARIQAALVTLQNLEGPGVGCPAASTTLVTQQKTIQNGESAPTGDGSTSDDAVTRTAAQNGGGAAASTSVSATAISSSATSDKPSVTASSSAPIESGSPTTGDIDPSLIPDLGAESGLNPTGSGDCDGAANGADGQPIKVPCQCPPDNDTYVQALNANVAVGFAVNNPTVKISFPTGDSPAEESTRITAALITLQNLEGPGVGCPASSTTLIAQQKALGV